MTNWQTNQNQYYKKSAVWPQKPPFLIWRWQKMKIKNECTYASIKQATIFRVYKFPREFKKKSVKASAVSGVWPTSRNFLWHLAEKVKENWWKIGKKSKCSLGGLAHKPQFYWNYSSRPPPRVLLGPHHPVSPWPPLFNPFFIFVY